MLVTGHTGFKGSWLTLWLRELGAEVAGLSNGIPTTPSHFECIRLDELIDDRRADVDDPRSVEEVVRDARPEVIFHLAARSLVGDGYEDPAGTYRTNVMGTLHVLEAARAAPSVKVVVIATSDKCYRNDGSGRAFTEDDPLGGADPYSNSKACAELLVDAYRSSFSDSGAPVLATVRAGNVIGGGDWGAQRLIPDAIRAWQEGKVLEVRRPSATRPWQDILDCLRGYLSLAEACWGDSRFAGAWNFGPDPCRSHPVEWVIEKLAAQYAHARWEVSTETHMKEASALSVDATKASGELGWRPVIGLPQSLERLASWYRVQSEGGDMREVSTAHLTAYMEEVERAAAKAS